MSDSENEGTVPEEQAPAAAPQPPPLPHKKLNLTVIALIAVSCVAVLLLIANLGLVAILGHEHFGGCRGFQEQGRWRNDEGPMMRGQGKGQGMPRFGPPPQMQQNPGGENLLPQQPPQMPQWQSAPAPVR